MLLDYYLNSRGITDVVSLKELIVSDRVKTVLSECMVNHVLRSKVSLPRAFASPNELADVLDKYCANFDHNGRPRVSAVGLGMRRHSTNPISATIQPQSLPSYAHCNKSNKSGPPLLPGAPPAAASSCRCFKCGSEQHLFKDCDRKGSVPQGPPPVRTWTPKPPSRVNRCAVEGDVHQGDTPVKKIEPTGGATSSSAATIAKTNFCGFIPPAPLEGARAMYADACGSDNNIVNCDIPVRHTVESCSDECAWAKV